MRAPRLGRLGFTLIEILSVVAILALVASFVIPNLGAYRTRVLRAEADKLAAQLELGRQRAIVTGVPHRLWLDLDAAAYRLEWRGDAGAESEVEGVADLDLRGNAPLPLSAPRETERSFEPVPGMFGRTRVIERPLFIGRIETSEGLVSRGESSVVFDRDGTASHTEIYLEDPDGHALAVDVFPLDDRVRIRHAGA